MPANPRLDEVATPRIDASHTEQMKLALKRPPLQESMPVKPVRDKLPIQTSMPSEPRTDVSEADAIPTDASRTGTG